MPIEWVALELLAALQVQVLVAALVVAALSWALGARSAAWRRRALVSLLAAAVALGWVAEGLRVPESGPADPQAATLRVLWLNVWAWNNDRERLASLIETADPDLVALGETRLVEALPLLGAVADRYPVRLESDQVARLVLFARVPVRAARLLSDGAGPLGVWTAELETGAGPVRLALVHARKRRARPRDFAGLAAWAAAPGPPALVMGDLNAAPWSPSVRRLVSEADLTHGRQGRGWQPSWGPAAMHWDPPPMLGLPIDHVLAGPGLTILDQRVGPPVGSDHRPLLATIAVTPPPHPPAAP